MTEGFKDSEGRNVGETRFATGAFDGEEEDWTSTGNFPPSLFTAVGIESSLAAVLGAPLAPLLGADVEET